MGHLFMNQRGYSTVLIGKTAILYQFFMQVSACWKASPSCMNGHSGKGYCIPLTSCTSFLLSQWYYSLKYCCKIERMAGLQILPPSSMYQLQTPIHCYMWRKESFTYCNLAVSNPIECSWHVGGINIKWLLFYIWLYENLWELDEKALISQ
mgnify:CR=1 FL=1